MNNYKHYFEFQGCASRGEYWGVNIVAYLLLIVVGVLAAIFVAATNVVGIVMGGLMIIAAGLLALWAVIATTVKRCRDAGINPWFTMTLFIPYVAVIPWIVFGCLKPEKPQ